MSSKIFFKIVDMFKLISIFGQVPIVNSRCYGRCYVKKLIPLSNFLKFHTASRRKFGKIVSKCFWQVLKRQFLYFQNIFVPNHRQGF